MAEAARQQEDDGRHRARGGDAHEREAREREALERSDANLRGVPIEDDADATESEWIESDGAEALEAEVDAVENENPAGEHVQNVEDGEIDFDELYDGYLGPDPPELPPDQPVEDRRRLP